MSFGFSGLGGGGGVGLKGLKGFIGFKGFIEFKGFRVQDCKGLFLLRVLVKDTFEGFAREGSIRGSHTDQFCIQRICRGPRVSGSGFR